MTTHTVSRIVKNLGRAAARWPAITALVAGYVGYKGAGVAMKVGAAVYLVAFCVGSALYAAVQAMPQALVVALLVGAPLAVVAGAVRGYLAARK